MQANQEILKLQANAAEEAEHSAAAVQAQQGLQAEVQAQQQVQAMLHTPPPLFPSVSEVRCSSEGFSLQALPWSWKNATFSTCQIFAVPSLFAEAPQFPTHVLSISLAALPND